jgi:hypothetical protein
MTDNITTLEDLKRAISVLKFEKSVREEQLKAQFDHVLESIKPFNILKQSIKEVTTSPYLIENVVGAALGIASGYVSKKIVVMGSASIFRKFFGTMMQFGVANLVAKKSHALKLIGQVIFNKFLTRKSEAADTLPDAIIHEDYTLLKTIK